MHWNNFSGRSSNLEPHVALSRSPPGERIDRFWLTFRRVALNAARLSSIDMTTSPPRSSTRCEPSGSKVSG